MPLEPNLIGFQPHENAAIVDALQPDLPEGEAAHDPFFASKIQGLLQEEINEQFVLEEALEVILDGESNYRAERYSTERCEVLAEDILKFRARLVAARAKKGGVLSAGDQRVRFS